jgi:hypothetical protein
MLASFAMLGGSCNSTELPCMLASFVMLGGHRTIPLRLAVNAASCYHRWHCVNLRALFDCCLWCCLRCVLQAALDSSRVGVMQFVSLPVDEED